VVPTRLDNWSSDEDEDEGGMQQQPQSDMPEQAVPEQPEPEPADFEAQTEDDNVVADKQAMEQAQQLDPVARGYAFDESNRDTQVLGF
jgi:type IV secretion system protein VirD4